MYNNRYQSFGTPYYHLSLHNRNRLWFVLGCSLSTVDFTILLNQKGHRLALEHTSLNLFTLHALEFVENIAAPTFSKLLHYPGTHKRGITSGY